jgi:hypothetical protein
MGFGSVHAFPMRLRDDVIGVVNVFRDGHEPLADDQARLARALSDIATIALLQQRAITRAEALAAQLQAALDDRIVIEQAKGAVARSFGIDVDEAFDLVRAHARRTRRRLTDVARDLVSDHGLIATLRTVSVRRTGGDRPATE